MSKLSRQLERAYELGRADAHSWRRADPPYPDRDRWRCAAYHAGHKLGVYERTEMEKRRREVLGCPCDGKKAGK